MALFKSNSVDCLKASRCYLLASPVLLLFSSLLHFMCPKKILLVNGIRTADLEIQKIPLFPSFFRDRLWQSANPNGSKEGVPGHERGYPHAGVAQDGRVQLGRVEDYRAEGERD